MRVRNVSPRLPAPTIRLRMTLLYGIVFLVSGAVLLTIGYELVRHNVLYSRSHYRNELQKLGLPALAFPGRSAGFGPGSAGDRVVEAVREQLRTDALHRLLIEYLIALGAMTAVSVAAGWLLAGRALRPLRAITSTARRVSGANLGERIGLQGPADELKELADTFDGMLGRLDAAFASQRHFVANASHELRTPLAIMRTELDVTMADPDASVEELRRMGEGVRDTVDRCERLIEGLLMLARSEAPTGHDEAADLAALAADCITDLRACAEEAHVEVQDELSPAWARGEPALLERMIANLIDNGVRHNEPGGWLRVSTRSEDGRARLTVANGGARIDPVAASTLTEPFRRLDRCAGGFGLGLSIVSSVVEAHGGTIEVSAPGEGGLSVRIELPAMPAPVVGIVPKRAARALTQS
ncbi:MAG: HAMP domain-containing histidine kinase [Solirubrobacterales bacterium]|nr:HAMP domain-containing histidine kinase [Solirubrobacterales bacterium]